MATPAKKKKESPKAKPKTPIRGYSDSTPQGRANKKKEEARKKKIKGEFSNKWSEPQFTHKFGNDPAPKKPKKK